jgi:hypothetical protein
LRAGDSAWSMLYSGHICRVECHIPPRAAFY